MLVTFTRLLQARAAAPCFALCLLVTASLAAETNEPFVTSWNTALPGTSDSNSITIPTSGDGYNYDVDWNNDGVYDTLGVTGSITHRFPVPGIQIIRIRGAFPQMRFDGGGDAQKLVSILFWGDIQWRSMESAFRGCKNLIVLAPDAPDLSGVTSLNSMFQDCEQMNGPVNHWHTAGVADMGEMFMGASAFNQPLGNWDVSQVVNFGGMFMNAHRFDQPLKTWNVSAAQNMRDMFAYASSFNADLTAWNTANVTDMTSMFRAARQFNRNLYRWNTSAVTTMARMFEDADSFDGKIDGWDVSSVTNMSRMFHSAKSFNQDISGWNTGAVTDMADMFRYTLSFNQPIGGWDVSQVRNISGMFYSAKAFDQDLAGWDVSKVERMKATFAWTIRFNRDISGWDVRSVRDMSGLFWGSVFDQDLSAWEIGQVTDLSDCFNRGRLSQANYDALLVAWGDQEVRRNVTLHVGTTTYCAGARARQRLIEEKGWIITDGGSQDLAPTAIGRDITVYLDGSGHTTIPADTLDYGSYDGCGQEQLSFSASQSVFSCADIGRVPVRLTVTDADGNASFTTVRVTVEDGPLGIFGMPQNITATADGEACTAIVSWTPPTTNCRATLTSTHQSGDRFPLGTTVVTYMASESSDAPVVASFVITVGTNLSAISEVRTPATCESALDGEAQILVSGGLAPYTYVWSHHEEVEQGAWATGLPAGRTIVSLTDANGCHANVAVNVPTSPVRFVSTPTDQSVITNTDDCRAVVTWSEPELSCSAGSLSANYSSGDTFPVGTTRVTYTYRSENGESLNHSFTVSVSSNLRLAIEQIVSPSCHAGQDGLALVTATGGVAPYTYRWSDEAGHAFAEGAFLDTLRAGQYEVTVADSSGCSAFGTLRITEPEALSLQATTAAGEFGGREIDLQVTGGTAPYVQQWTGADNTTDAFEEDLHVWDNGLYTVAVTDAAGCGATLDVAVTELSDACHDLTFEVYPNPTPGKFAVKFSGCAAAVPMRIYNSHGHLIATTNSDTLEDDLDFSSLTRGLYYIRVDGRYEVMSRSVLVY